MEKGLLDSADLSRVRESLPCAPIVCVLGSRFKKDESRILLEAIARRLAKEAFLAVFVSCGRSRVQETFARSCGQRVWNLVLKGSKSAHRIGVDIEAGMDVDEQTAIFLTIGDVYLFLEGELSASHAAAVVHERGALLIPLKRTLPPGFRVKPLGVVAGLAEQIISATLPACDRGSAIARGFPMEAMERPHYLHGKQKGLWGHLDEKQRTPGNYSISVARLVALSCDEAIRKDPLKWLPRWAVAEDVFAFNQDIWMRSDMRHKPLPLGCVCGRGLLLAALSNVITWPTYFLFAYVGYISSSCSEAGHDLPHYSSSVWILFLIYFIVSVTLEIRTFGYVSYSQVQALGSFKFLGWTLSFKMWSLLMFGFSILGHMDIATNSFLLATILYVPKCEHVHVFDELWRTCLKQSFLGFLPDGILDLLTIPNLSFWLWTFALIQPVSAFLDAFPIALAEPASWEAINPSQVTYKPAMDSPSKPETAQPPDEPRLILGYRTPLVGKQNHGNALMVVAEVARMGAVTYNHLQFALSKFKPALLDLEKEGSHTNVSKCLTHANGLFQRATFRIFYQGFLETSLQLNLQVTLLGIQHAATLQRRNSGAVVGNVNTVSPQMLLTIVSGLLIALKRVFDIYELFVAAETIMHATKKHEVTACKISHVLHEFKTLQVKSWFCVFGTTLFLLSLLYAIVKLWAVFNCKSGLWNFAFYPPNGCVDLQGH